MIQRRRRQATEAPGIRHEDSAVNLSVYWAVVDVERGRVGVAAQVASVIIAGGVEDSAEDDDSAPDACLFECAGDRLGMSSADPAILDDQRTLDVASLLERDPPVVRIKSSPLIAVAADLADILGNDARDLGTEP